MRQKMTVIHPVPNVKRHPLDLWELERQAGGMEEGEVAMRPLRGEVRVVGLLYHPAGWILLAALACSGLAVYGLLAWVLS